MILILNMPLKVKLLNKTTINYKPYLRQYDHEENDINLDNIKKCP
tara:strand:+ start:9215 stop:9349 length:135 start_codon:yes stop_codon:yes gene_type:complete